jgi:hypothetical protein
MQVKVKACEDLDATIKLHSEFKNRAIKITLDH